MRNYRGDLAVSSEIMCGILAGIMMVAAVFLPLVDVVTEMMFEKYVIHTSLSKNPWYIAIVGGIILFYFLSVCLDQKWMVLFSLAGIGWTIFSAIKYYFVVENSMIGFNVDFEKGMHLVFGDFGSMERDLCTVKMGIGFFLFIGASLLMVIGICLAHKE